MKMKLRGVLCGQVGLYRENYTDRFLFDLEKDLVSHSIC